MVLDALIKIKNEIDPTLTFRRSCREGISGSCAMNMDGQQPHLHHRDRVIKGDVQITPLPHLDVVKDLVPDLTHPYAQYASIQPWLKTASPAPSRERLQKPKDRAKLEGCTNASCASAAPPAVQAIGGIRPVPRARDLAPGLSLDRRQPGRSTGERLDQLEDPFRLYRCHTIMNCAKLSQGTQPGQGDRGEGS